MSKLNGNKTNGLANLKKNLTIAGYLSVIASVCYISPANADWFQVANIRNELITPVYSLINDNLGYIAFAMGGATTFFARGGDFWQKGLAFGVGSLGTAGAVKIAQAVLHLG